jgi:hypothetical protein
MSRESVISEFPLNFLDLASGSKNSSQKSIPRMLAYDRTPKMSRFFRPLNQDFILSYAE